MAPSKKRRKLNASTSGTNARTSKPTPHVESVNALAPEEFWSRYCQEVYAIKEPSLSSDRSPRSKIFFEATPIQRPTEAASDKFLLFRAASQLSSDELNGCFNLIAQTSKTSYEASSMGWSPAKKRQEMRLPDLKYFLLMVNPGARLEKDLLAGGIHYHNKDSDSIDDSTIPSDYEIKGFLSFMPTYEDGKAVFYIYEVHLDPALQGSGLGRIFMSIAESVSQNIGHLEKMMLTVFRSNTRARSFYEKLDWSLDENSPEWVNLRGRRRRQCDYLILSKSLGVHISRGDISQKGG